MVLLGRKTTNKIHRCLQRPFPVLCLQTLSHEPQVLKQGLLHLNEVLQSLEPLHTFLEPPGGSVLLRELASAPNLSEATSSARATPLLHSLAAAHAYITMFTHVCKVAQVGCVNSYKQWPLFVV